MAESATRKIPKLIECRHVDFRHAHRVEDSRLVLQEGRLWVCLQIEGVGKRRFAPGDSGYAGSGAELLRRNVKRFRGGLVFKDHRLVYHSSLGLRVIKKQNIRCRQ